MKIRFGLAADDYGKYRHGFPDSLFDRLRPRGVGLPGQDVVDLGTGTGTLARGFAKRGCRVVGVDRDESMLEQARVLAAEDGVDVSFRCAPAEDTKLDADSADVVTAGQCWHWFDRPAAQREVERVLRPDGLLVLANFDWLPLPGNVVEATERLIEQHNPAWKLGGGIGVHPFYLPELGAAGYRGLETFSYDVDAPYTHESWRGRIRASAGVGASLPPAAVDAFDRDLAALLAERFPGPALPVPHRVFSLIARTPAG